jgi:hypothetical protein
MIFIMPITISVLVVLELRPAGPNDPSRLRVAGRRGNPFCLVQGIIILIDAETVLARPRFICPSCAIGAITHDGAVEPIARTPV